MLENAANSNNTNMSVSPDLSTSEISASPSTTEPIQPASKSTLPLLITIAVVLGISLLAAGYMWGQQSAQQAVVPVPPSSAAPHSVAGTPQLQPLATEFVLDADPNKITYSNDASPGSLTIAYNKVPQKIGPVELLVQNYPQFAEAAFYYQGDVQANTILVANGDSVLANWHMVSAVQPVFGAPTDPMNTVNSAYEAMPGEPETITILLSPAQDNMIVIDCGCVYSSDKKPPLLAGMVTEVESGQLMWPVYNFFHITADSTNTWQSSYIKLFTLGNTTGGGGELTITSDTLDKYRIVYFAQPFAEVYSGQKAADTVQSIPIYKADKQQNTYKATDGHTYEKYFMQAENGMTYLLYK